jgi:uncharacterized protein DUF3309
MGWVILIVLLIILCGSGGVYTYHAGYGHPLSGGFGLIVIILILLLVFRG